jgi:plasmid stabilization system protein ParE
MIVLRFHPSALKELRKSTDYYLIRSPQAARRFAEAVERAIEQILEAPDRFARVSKRERGCRVAGFPYQIVYRTSGEVIFVVAVAHAKRRPGYWSRRR